MATIIWKFPIDVIHGKLKKGVFGAAQRKSPNAHGKQDNYSVFYGKRTAPYSIAELEQQDRFAAVARAAAARRTDPNKKIADITAFNAQSNIPTLNQFIWKQAEAEVDAAQEEENAGGQA